MAGLPEPYQKHHHSDLQENQMHNSDGMQSYPRPGDDFRGLGASPELVASAQSGGFIYTPGAS